jgi:hypothetical protein
LAVRIPRKPSVLRRKIVGSNQASATEDSFVSVISMNPATLRIDNPNCDPLELRIESAASIFKEAMLSDPGQLKEAPDTLARRIFARDLLLQA